MTTITITDTMLAATYRAEGVERLARPSWRHVAVFAEIEIIRIAAPGDGDD